MLSALLAYVLSLACPTPTAWIEHDGDFDWYPVCADENGVRVFYPWNPWALPGNLYATREQFDAANARAERRERNRR